LAKFDLKEYARRGAEARVAELQAELAGIFRAFPDLRVRRPGRRAPAAITSETPTPKAARRRSQMTAAQRKAVSARMKKYWAERRKAKSAK
jgi:hypothetical protein